MTLGFADRNKHREQRRRDGPVIVFSLLKTVCLRQSYLRLYKENAQSILVSINRNATVRLN